MELTTWQRLRTRAYLFAVGVKRHMTLGTRVALIDGDKIYLIRQTYLPGWHFPGGGVEPGETAAFSGGRELEEETGYRPCEPMELRGLYLNVNSATNRDHIAFFVCRRFEKVAEVGPNYEIAEAGWFPLDALPAEATPPTQRRVEEMVAGAPAAAMW
jgi:8-oxo-dGTP pyrophosphatase MutT (NUDIX family)